MIPPGRSKICQDPRRHPGIIFRHVFHHFNGFFIILRRAEVFVDTYAGAKGEAGDILQAIEEGEFTFGQIQAELAEVLAGNKPGRSAKEAITLFKSVGASLEDLAAAIEVWESLPESP